MLSHLGPDSLEIAFVEILGFLLELDRHVYPVPHDYEDCTAYRDAFVNLAGPKVVDLPPSDRSPRPLLRVVHEALVVLGDGLRRGGHPDLDGRRVERGERGLAAVDLLQLDAVGVLDDKAKGRAEGADAIDLGEGPSVLLESFGLGLAALQDAPDGIDELLHFLILLIELLVVGELLGGGGRHVRLFAYLVRKFSD